MEKDWSHPLFDLDEAGSYCCAAACPCVKLAEISTHFIALKKKSSTRSAFTTFLSCLIDFPLYFCSRNIGERALNQAYYGGEDDGNDDNDGEDVWDPHGIETSYDWWPLNWCNFYSLGACESCCADCCIGPKVRSSSFPLLFVCASGCVYPLCVCPLACLLRQKTITEMDIQTESLPCTCAKSLFCTPCPIIQVLEELQSAQQNPHLINSMR